MLWVSKSKVYASGKFYYESVVSLVIIKVDTNLNCLLFVY